MGIGIIAAIILIIIVICVIMFNKSQNKKSNQKQFEEVTGTNQEDNTMLLNDDDETVLMRSDEQDENNPYIQRSVWLRDEDGSPLLHIEGIAELTIGRKTICDIQIKGDQSVSGVHCTLFIDGQGNPILRDNNSSNGTFVNNERLDDEKVLENGDIVEIGRQKYTVQVH